jgi:hypothetical protein
MTLGTYLEGTGIVERDCAPVLAKVVIKKKYRGWQSQPR